jgi:hypothetical protein
VTTPGTGGLPERRLDQQRTFNPPTQAPGAAAGVIRARIVIVSGGSGVFGVFVYSGTPGPGNLVASLAGAGTTTDPFGNPVRGGGFAAYGATGQAIFAGPVGGISELRFFTGTGFEVGPANIAAEPAGAGAAQIMELFVSGPQGGTPGSNDWVQIEMVSGNEGGSSTASGFLNYIDTGGGVHAWLTWDTIGAHLFGASSVNGITPGTGTLNSPGPAAGTPPSGAGVASADTVAGSLLSFFDAFSSTYNTTQTAVSDIVGVLDAWGV